MKYVAFTVLVSSIVFSGRAVADEPSVVDHARSEAGRLYRSCRSSIERGLSYWDANESYPDTVTWGTDWLKTTKKDNELRINAALLEMAYVLQESPTLDAIDDFEILNQERVTVLEGMADLRDQADVAPDAGVVKWWEYIYTTSRQNIKDRIDSATASLSRIESEQEAIAQSLPMMAADDGVEITEEEAPTLLTTDLGKRVLRLGIVFAKAKKITEYLVIRAAEEKASATMSKRYYGYYLMMVRALDVMQDAFVEEVESVISPRLDKIETQAKKTGSDARLLLQRAGKENRPTLQANLAAIDLTLRAVRIYRNQLAAILREIQQRNSYLEEMRDTAENTYEVLVISTDVAKLIRESTRQAAFINRFELPPLQLYKNQELREAFRSLEAQLGAGG